MHALLRAGLQHRPIAAATTWSPTVGLLGLVVMCAGTMVQKWTMVLADRRIEWADSMPASAVAAGSSKKFRWRCLQCTAASGLDHVWKATPANVLHIGSGCPYHTKFSARLCGAPACAICGPRSVAGSAARLTALGIEWADSEPAGMVTKGSGALKWWRCLRCHDAGANHRWQATPNNVLGVAATRCPFHCEPAKVLCGDLSCGVCKAKSVASHAASLAAREIEWASPERPELVLAGSSVAHLWKCLPCTKKCGFDRTWSALPSSVLGGPKSGCPHCNGTKTQELLSVHLSSFCASSGLRLVREATFPWCKRTNVLRFDFCVYRVDGSPVGIIELDGIQHFRDVGYFNATATLSLRNDTAKTMDALTQGIPVLRIYQPDVWQGRDGTWDLWKRDVRTFIDAHNRDSPPAPSQAYSAKDVRVYNDHESSLRSALAAAAAAGGAPPGSPATSAPVPALPPAPLARALAAGGAALLGSPATSAPVPALPPAPLARALAAGGGALLGSPATSAPVPALPPASLARALAAGGAPPGSPATSAPIPALPPAPLARALAAGGAALPGAAGVGNKRRVPEHGHRSHGAHEESPPAKAPRRSTAGTLLAHFRPG
jgi:hypothetical protein